MFGPVRGAWDRQWKGWWGDNPPYHAPVFVLTHHPRDPQPMDGGTTFHFVTGGIKSALLQAREAAGDRNVSIHGGATHHQLSTSPQAWSTSCGCTSCRAHARCRHRLFDGVPSLNLEQLESRATDSVTHVTYRVLS